MNRRHFLLGLGAIGAVSALPFTPLFNKTKQWLVSGASDKKGNFFAAAFDLSGQLISQVSLPARAHEILPIDSKPGHALVIARRPGQYILEVDFSRGEVVEEISVLPENRFYGHGRLIDNDQVLITTENDYQRGKGLIVLRDVKSQKVIEQYDSGGVGPHQLAIMPNSNENLVVIANGGIQTHPEQGRKKLNLDTMQPNLSYLSLNNGQVVDSFALDNQNNIHNRKLSIRHLDVSDKGKVVVGLQYQGASTDDVPLALAHQGEAQLQFLKANAETWRSMNHYTASVCINSADNTVAITCPKGNLLTFWDLHSNKFISSYKLKDVAGIALAADKFIASTGRGKTVSQVNPASSFQAMHTFNNIRWDNHLASISA